MVPPHARHIHRVTRFELRHLRVFQCIPETRKSLEVGILEINHADDLVGWRKVEWPGIQVRDLSGWKQDETAPARCTAGEIVRQVVMCSDPRAVTHPDKNQRIKAIKVDVIF